jgi:uncharacterized protein (TIGR00255 family)
MKSMTAYGRALLSNQWGRFTAEIQTVNRKHLDIQISMPKELARFETEVRKQVAAAVSRGHVTLKIFATLDKNTLVGVVPNLPLARQIKEGLLSLGNELGLKIREEQLFSVLAATPDLWLYSEETHEEAFYLETLHEVVSRALNQLLEMRTREGEGLQKDILHRISLLREYAEAIAHITKEQPSNYYEKLKLRLRDIHTATPELEERILRELAVYTASVDVQEEQVRFILHLKQLEEWTVSNKTHLGKTLEFLLQEMSREINTLGNKVSHAEVSSLVVNVKRELECIREQVQNIE